MNTIPFHHISQKKMRKRKTFRCGSIASSKKVEAIMKMCLLCAAATAQARK